MRSIIYILFNCFYFISARTVARSDEKDYNIIVIQSKNALLVLTKSGLTDKGYAAYDNVISFRHMQFGDAWWSFGVEARGDDIIRAWDVYKGLNYNTTSEKWESSHRPLISKIVKECSNITLEIYDWLKDKWVNRSEFNSSNAKLDEVPCKYGMPNITRIDNSGVYNSDSDTWMRPIPCFKQGLFDWNTGMSTPDPENSNIRTNKMAAFIVFMIYVFLIYIMLPMMLIIPLIILCCNMCRRSRG